jgi:ankyrin repeat protein
MSKTALFAAAKDWDARAVRRSLADAPDLVTARDARGRTALHICAGTPLLGHASPPAVSIATARELLKAGTDVNVVHEIPDGREVFPATPLWYALARGRNRPLARFLLKAGANPDHCLWTVIWSKEPDLVRLLLRAGSQPNVRFDGETPLIYAARLGRERRSSPWWPPAQISRLGTPRAARRPITRDASASRPRFSPSSDESAL